MISEKFAEEYQKLNPQQKEAVDSIEGPVMVIAGPGTGKTTILTLRIANILRLTDTPPSGILALTFTEAGVKTMRLKLREIIGKRALEVPIHTFHGFAASVISEFQDHFPHLSRSKQITDVEAGMILKQILKQKQFTRLRPLGEPDFYINKILGTISDAKQEAWTPEVLASFAKEEIKRVTNASDSISTRGESKGKLKGGVLKCIEKCERTILFAEVYEEYEVRKKEERKIDFDDLIFELVIALREDKLLLQMLQEKFLYILVDEHQDTNDAQNLIIHAIAHFFDTPNLFVVGDEKQAIYRFQGASVENFLSFQKIWSQMKTISLEENYRSHQSILDASFKMIEENYAKNEHKNLRIKLKSMSKKQANPIDIVLAPNLNTENTYLVKKLQELTEKDKEKMVAIIVRRNSDISKILWLLETNNIPASAERGANIFSHPAGVIFFSLLEFLADPSKIESLLLTIGGGLWKLDFEKRVNLIKLARSGKLGEIEKEIPIISKLQKEIDNAGVLSYLNLVTDLSFFTEMVSKTPLGAEVWRGIYTLATDLAETNHIENARQLIEMLLSYKASAERRSIKIKSGENDAQITVMTAHSSKGLEFDYVFLPYATEESWIRKNHASYFILPREKEEDDDIRDERRLFYVALTRAKKHIVLSYSLEDGLGKMFTPLRFIDELDNAHISKIDLPPNTLPVVIQSIENKHLKLVKEKIEYAKRTLLENGLSVTALNHFLKCPSEFFYKSILKLPEPPSASSEKGNAMHEALSNVWKAEEKEVVAIEKIIKTTVTSYFKHSLLPLFEKEMILEELTANAPKVALALVNHFAQTGIISTETWIENYLRHSYQSKPIEIRLHGKLDAMIEKENEILVFDYKTREAMSENAVKGLTKDSTGDYFRQLVFYKILLESNSKYATKSIEPALVFIKPDSKGRCPTITLSISKDDIEKVRSEIASLIDSVWSGQFLTDRCNDKNCKYCGYKKLTLQN